MFKFSLAQLQAFESICRLGTFHAAAAELSVTQPTISLRIRELEAAAGVRLFERSGRRMQPSADGAVMLEYVSQGLSLLAEMEQQVKRRDPLQGVLRLGMSDMMAMTCANPLLSQLESSHPGTRIELTVVNSWRLAHLLIEDQLDFALLAHPPGHASVSIEPLALADVAWIGSAQQALPVDLLKPRDLRKRMLLTVPAPSPLNDCIHNWCAAERHPMLRVSTCNSIAVIARLACSGNAMGVLPVCTVDEALRRGDAIRYRQHIPFEPLTICAAFRPVLNGRIAARLLRSARDAMAQSGLFTMLRNT